MAPLLWRCLPRSLNCCAPLCRLCWSYKKVTRRNILSTSCARCGRFSRVPSRRRRSSQLFQIFLGAWAKRRGFTGSIELVPNAVNAKHFAQATSLEKLREIRERLGKKEGDIFLITTSRLVHKNAVDDVISALPHVPRHVHFAVLGLGPTKQSCTHSQSHSVCQSGCTSWVK